MCANLCEQCTIPRFCYLHYKLYMCICFDFHVHSKRLIHEQMWRITEYEADFYMKGRYFARANINRHVFSFVKAQLRPYFFWLTGTASVVERS